jgi:hypothetical protein
MEPENQKPEMKKKDKKKKEQYVEPRQIDINVPIYKIRTNKLVLKNLHMKTQQAEKMMLTFSSKDTAKTVTEIHVTQAVAGKVKDGIVFVVRTGYAKK